MKNLEWTKVIKIWYYVVDGLDTYRRSEDGDWEHQIGESWEPVYPSMRDELENLFEEEYQY